jgi:uncharacterized membrane protein
MASQARNQIRGQDRSQDQWLEIAMGTMLRAGVTISAFVVLVGGVVYLAQPHKALPDYRHFNTAVAGPVRVGAILSSSARLDSTSLIEFGILLLIATPVCRVIFGVIGFAALRDWFYAAISAIVLAVLLVSFSLGR